MLEASIKFVCAYILDIIGYYIIKKIINRKDKLDKRKILIFLLNSILIVAINYIKYNVFSSFLIFIINTFTYKVVFKSNIEESFIYTGILTLLLLIAEAISLFQIKFISLNEILNNITYYFISNIIVVIILLILINIPIIKRKLPSFYQILSNIDLHVSVIITVLTILLMSSIMYDIFKNYNYSLNLISDLLTVNIIILISIIFIYNSQKYNKLMNEYDNLFIYVQNFEEWIEKEQLNRHEYKNQLAVLYSLSKELKVKNKIQDILKDNLNIENPIVNKLKVLPKGGIKGLMYYKSIIAQNNKLNLTIDISIDPKGILNKLNNEERNKICKLIGIYYDNAIEAAKESRKKNILIEIYELSNKVNIVFSNTFKKTSLITNKELKGVSTKGKGRGNGLFFAKKIINNNNFLYEKSEIIDHYYIETLTIIK